MNSDLQMYIEKLLRCSRPALIQLTLIVRNTLDVVGSAKSTRLCCAGSRMLEGRISMFFSKWIVSEPGLREVKHGRIRRQA